MENILNITKTLKTNENTSAGKDHKVVINNRNSISVTGVTKAESANETCIILCVLNTKMFISGHGLHIEKLDVDSGVVEAIGEIDAIKYNKTGKDGNMFKRIFK